MDWKFYLTVFATIFIAELGDKTQLTVFLFGAQANSNIILVILAASLALIASTVLAATAGSFVGNYVDPSLLQKIAGVMFIGLGIYLLMNLQA